MSAQEGFKAAADAIQKTEKVVEGMVKKAWSILDAATEKMKPSEQVSQGAILKIQGQEQG